MLSRRMKMEKKVRKKAFLYGLAAILIASMLGMFCYNFGVRFGFPSLQLPSAASPSAFLATFPSLDAIRNFLASNSKTQGPFPYYGPMDMAFAKSSGTVLYDANSEGTAVQYSSTNIQVAGVDEADSVKTDGEYLYVLSGATVSIVKAYPVASAGVVSKIALDDLYPAGIFVSGDRLAVLGSKYSTSSISRSYYGYVNVEIKSFVRIYDIHDRTNPTLLRDLSLSGSYFNSRKIGDYVYLVVSQPAYVIYDTVILPKIYSDGQIKEVAPSEIHYFNGSDDYYQYTTFVAANMQNATEAPVYLTVMLGGTSTMYVSSSNMYVAFRDWADDNTSIYRVHVEGRNMTCEAKGKVRGHELNQFSMDEYGGNFRMATTTWMNGSQQNNLYVMNMSLNLVGRLENLATGENLHSARFMGNRCYLVTFIKTDPLFAIDLSDPTKPAVLGELKIPGYSDYLHPYDETHLIGVGKEAVGAEEGNFAWYQGIKVSLFDVSNVTDPKQIANYTIGDRGSDSPILQDHKAFLFDESKNLLVIPVLVAEIDQSQYPGGVPPYAYGQPVWQGAYVFDISLEQGLKLRGGITHLDSGMYIWNSTYWVKRSLYIENVLYTVSDRKVEMNSLTDLSLMKEILLP